MNWKDMDWDKIITRGLLILTGIILVFLVMVGVKSFKSEQRLNDLKAEKLRMEIQTLKTDTIK